MSDYEFLSCAWRYCPAFLRLRLRRNVQLTLWNCSIGGFLPGKIKERRRMAMEMTRKTTTMTTLLVKKARINAVFRKRILRSISTQIWGSNTLGGADDVISPPRKQRAIAGKDGKPTPSGASGVAAAAAAAAAAASSHISNGTHIPDSSPARPGDDDFPPKRQTRSATAAATHHGSPAPSPSHQRTVVDSSLENSTAAQLLSMPSQAASNLMNLLPFAGGSYNPYVTSMAGPGGFPAMGMYQLPSAPPGFLMGPPGMLPNPQLSREAPSNSGDGTDGGSDSMGGGSRFQQKKGGLSIHIPDKVAGKPVRVVHSFPSVLPFVDRFLFSN
jgi:hypothetical protein